MPSAEFYARASEGLAKVGQYNRDRPAREAREAEARTRQKTAELKYKTTKNRAPIETSQAKVELEQAQNQLRKEQTSRLGTDMFKAFDMYESDGSARHLNNFLQSAKANPAGAAEWGNWTRFDNLVRSPETEAMLGRIGITDVDGYFNDLELVKSKVVGTSADGKQELFDMNAAYQGSGYLRHASNRTIAAQMERAKLDDMLKGVESADSNMIEQIMKDQKIGALAATKQYYEAKNSGKVTGSALERIARDLMSKDENLSYEDAIKQASTLKAAPSSAQKDIGVTAVVRQEIHEIAGGDFYAADLSDPKIRSKVGEKMSDLEQATGKTLSSETKRVARKLRSMVGLGGVAGEKLTDEETGVMDNMLHGLRKYFSDNVEGVEGTAAYSAMRNVTRNALMGATLTPKELTEFDKAAGTLKQQLGPVLQQLKVQLNDIKGQIESVMNFEDPMMAKYYLGMSQDQADAAVEQIDRRLEHIGGYAKGQQEVQDLKLSPVPNKPKVPAAQRFKELTSGS